MGPSTQPVCMGWLVCPVDPAVCAFSAFSLFLISKHAGRSRHACRANCCCMYSARAQNASAECSCRESALLLWHSPECRRLSTPLPAPLRACTRLPTSAYLSKKPKQPALLRGGDVRLLDRALHRVQELACALDLLVLLCYLLLVRASGLHRPTWLGLQCRRQQDARITEVRQ
jgi:hypothetical protein